MYIEKLSLIDNVSKKILHFAPEPALKERLTNIFCDGYIMADLYPKHADICKIDITQMPFESGSFDLIIANHVLEHVDNDRMALKEIRRVLSPGGKAILQTPYASKLNHTLEDSGISTNEARLLMYGQEDHVRLYGRDLIERICQVGLVSKVIEHDTLFKDLDAVRFGVNPRESLLLFENP